MASQTMMKILLNYTPELPCILFNSLYQKLFLPSKARIESLLRLITVAVSYTHLTLPTNREV